MKRLGSNVLVIAQVGAVLFSAGSAAAASLQQVTDLGSTPTATKMYAYVPDDLADSPAIMVLLHSCENTAAGYFGQMNFAAEADEHGFILIYPESPSSNMNRCWDVNSEKSLKHDGGGDSQSVALMVKYAIDKWKADPKRVFSVGGSSGGMITNVLLATYPDVFAGGASFAGVPYYCFQGSSFWNNECSGGMTTKSGKEWGDLVRNAYPSYSGPRPRMQIWHGTEDPTLSYHNFGEQIKQWTNVLGVSETPSSTLKDTPKAPWTRTLYTDSCGTVQVEANSAQGQTHGLQTKGWAEGEVVRFFGLDGTNPIKTCEGGMGGAGGTGGAAGPAGAAGASGGSAPTGGVGGVAGAGVAGAPPSGGAGAGTANGGTAGASGGSAGSGAVSPAGGVATGGASSGSGGGSTASGGTNVVGQAGASGSGAASNAAGAPMTGPSGGAGTPPSNAEDDSGCSVHPGGAAARSGLFFAGLAMAALALRARRRRRTS